jgi:hypothetical protein
MVLGDLVVDEAHDVWANGSPEDVREALWSISGLILFRMDRDEGASGGERLEEK